MSKFLGSFVNKIRGIFVLLIAIYITSPVIYRYSPYVQRSLLFMNNINQKINLLHPEKLGIKCIRTFRLNLGPISGSEIKIELGVWHILPESSLSACVTKYENNRTYIQDKLAFADSRPIILYTHGNKGNRAADNRNKLYRKLAYEHDYHIITFDYRGFGDSTYVQPTTDGLSTDARHIYKWLLRQPHVTKERIIVWGHSLGTGVAVRMVADLPANIRPKGLVLEAPFDSVANAIANHPYTTPFRIIPYFDYFFVEPITETPELNFDSVSRIGDIKSTPIMILHAEDDSIIPIRLGYNLYKRATEQLGNAMVKFVQIDANHGLGHNYICSHDETMTIVKHFMDELIQL